ncbi:NAD-dependent epimerase/dehydratase family protein [Actinophytocola sp.]|uniref:NAD-dependent epimerase/dehydratase family protein n=1 Tax=Actinophytocola sp. TaxID=1872138 RepID=UPI00389AABD8
MNAVPSLTDKRMVVTGAAGFIGSHLSGSLVRAGATVVGIDRRNPQQDQTAAVNLADLLEAPNFSYAVADLRTASLGEHLRDVDVVFHLAAIPGVRPSWGPEFEDYTSCNILATQRLMDAATHLHVPRVVVASSSSVYGATDGSPSKESDLPQPTSPYGVTKLAAEQLCLAHAARDDCPTTAVALRYFSVFGPRQRHDMFIHRALMATMTGQPLRLFGHGHQRRDFTFIDDVVAATIAAATARTGNAVINVGAGVEANLLHVLDVICGLVGLPTPVVVVNSHAGDVEATLADTTVAHHVLNWRPTTTLIEGIAQQLSSLDRTVSILNTGSKALAGPLQTKNAI